MRAFLVLVTLFVLAVCKSTSDAAPPPSLEIPTVSSAPQGDREIWQRRFASHEECVQARIGVNPPWPRFLAEAICKETRYGTAVPPGYYDLGPCATRQKDRKKSGILKWAGETAWPAYCARTDGEKHVPADGIINLR